MVLQTEAIKSPDDFKKHFNDGVWYKTAEDICRENNIAFNTLSRSEGGEHIVFFVDDNFIVKIYTPFRGGFAREKRALEFAHGKTSLKLPQMICSGTSHGVEYLVMTQMRGAQVSRHEWLRMNTGDQINLLIQLAQGLRQLHWHPAEEIDFDWDKFIEQQIETCIDRQIAAKANPRWLDALPKYLEESVALLPKNSSHSFLHGDIHFGNLRVKNEDGQWVISGLFDLADSLTGFHEYEFLAPTLLMIQGQGDLQREFFRAYGYADTDIDETLRRRLMLLTVLYECSDLRRYALRLSPAAVDLTFDELERAIWPFAG